MTAHTTVHFQRHSLKTTVSLLALFFVAGMGAIGANLRQNDKAQPPGSLEIFDTLNRLWMDKKYAEADAYVRGLHSAWSNYAPAELTWAIHAFHFGSQLENCIDRAKALKAVLKKDIEMASPLFVSELGDYIGREEGTLSFYEANGHDRARRAAERCLAFDEARRTGETSTERVQRVCPWASAELAADESELSDLREVYGDWTKDGEEK